MFPHRRKACRFNRQIKTITSAVLPHVGDVTTGISAKLWIEIYDHIFRRTFFANELRARGRFSLLNFYCLFNSSAKVKGNDSYLIPPPNNFVKFLCKWSIVTSLIMSLAALGKRFVSITYFFLWTMKLK